MTEYTPWRERFAPPQVRRPNQFVAAADQVVRYGRQLCNIEWNVRVASAEHGMTMEEEIYQRSGYAEVWAAYAAFLSQFQGSTREVLSRTFWQAYHS